MIFKVLTVTVYMHISCTSFIMQNSGYVGVIGDNIKMDLKDIG